MNTEQTMRKRNSLLNGDKTIEIVDAEPSDVPGMASCHSLAFEGRFMTEMGHKWLCILYRYFIKHSEGISLVAVNERNQVLGFAVGGGLGIRDEMIKYAIVRYPHIILSNFLTNSSIRKVMLKELAKKIFRRGRAVIASKVSTKQVSAIRTGSLLSICVKPEYMGTGIADKLIELFQKKCAEKGYKRLTLTVVKQNARAIAFYRKHRWREVGKFGESIRFVLEL